MKYFLLLILILCSCTNPGKSAEILEKQGYKNIKTGGYSFFGCGKDDWFRTKFVAIAPYGIHDVNGVVCCGFLKYCTIRVGD